MPPDLSALLRPRSVAVIGASNRRGTIGAEILHNLLSSGFVGPVYPVNPTALAVQAVRAWPDVASIPGDVDLAVVVVPQPQVLDVVDQCLAKGVRGVLVITAGFKETGPEGAALEAELARRVRAAGARLVGPNCLGIVTTDPDTRLDATFAPTFPPAGTVSVASQSGALGVAMLDYARELNIGVRDFVSIGNKADVSGNDLIAWWGADPGTQVILLYLESFGNPARFAEISQRVSRTKPIVAVKSGRSKRGLLAASSHTGSLAGADAAVQAVVDDTGIIRVDTVDELFDMAAFLAHQPIPPGRRVAILTNAGGPGILATDACEAWGLTVPDLPTAVGDELRSFLPPAASVKNPVDMIASANAEQFARATRVLLDCDAVDALIVLFVPPITTQAEQIGQAIVQGAAGSAKPVISCFMGRHGIPEALTQLQAGHVPSYAFPESAVRVLARAVRYGEWRARPQGALVVPEGTDIARACALVAQATPDADGWLPPADVIAVLAALGVSTPPAAFAEDPGQAALLARRMGFPVVMKLVADGVVHKSDLGGVRVGIRDASEVFDAWDGIVASATSHGCGDAVRGMLVQSMVEGGVETIIGVTRDPSYGPLVMFGLGGVNVEVLRDVGFRLAPLTDRSARELVRGIRGFPLLDGHRGAARADVAALEATLLRVGALAAACPRILELDLNPVRVMGQGCVALDARIRVGA
jgi:acetyl coenzyme A synthetase (ADP forming)-like protein